VTAIAPTTEATAASPRVDIARLMRPRSIAIVGVSPEPGSAGGGALDNLDRAGYRGTIHLVSRNRAEVRGRRCVASIDDLPDDIDVVLLMLPRAAIVDAVAACARRGVGAVIIFAAGFGEAGGEWQAAQDRISALARGAGIALCGPNCLGIVNYIDGIALTFSVQPRLPPPNAPGIAIVAQSGGLSSILRGALLTKHLPVSYAVSTGNEAVLGLADYIGFLIDDAATRVIAVFAEQIRQPQRFLAEAARARDAGKTVLLLHPGRGAAARAAAKSHTGALAGDHAVMRALATHAGIIVADGLDELIDTTELALRFPQAPAAGAAVLTDSGAFGGLTLDFCDAIGLELPPLSAVTAAKLKAELPDFMVPANPVDVTAQGILDLDLYVRTIRPLLADPGFGSLFVAPIVSTAGAFAMAKLSAILKAVSGSPRPVVIGLLGDEATLPAELTEAVDAAGLPLFRSPERGLRALAKLTAHGRRLARRRSPLAAPGDGAGPSLPSGVVLAEHAGKAWLAGHGIAVPAGGLAADLDAALALATRVGYPVALKLQSAALPHKSDAGAVVLDVGSAAALTAAWPRLHDTVRRAHPDLGIDGVLVEAMAKPGLDMIVGARRDPDWGPVLVIGLGGIWTEALADNLVLPTDLDADELAAELNELKAVPLLAGFRGAAPRDVAALVGIAQRIGAVIRAHPEIADLEINPLRVFERGCGAAALDVLIATG
jgi:acyl-CoA synthetase (NDP forming)